MDDIKAKILDCGYELFSTKGYKDTNISDITKAVGIGTGTFYNYYASKDELFLVLFLQENKKLKMSIMELVEPDKDPMKAVKDMIAKNLDGMKTNPILKEWFNRDLFCKLEKEFYRQGGINSINELMNSNILELIRLWKCQGKIRDDIEDDMILAIFNSIPYIDVHKEELGVQYFPCILVYLVEFIMKGLTICQNQADSDETKDV